jgi:uncharacterized protein (UPF0333 family)
MIKYHAYYIVVNDNKGNLYRWEGNKKQLNEEINLHGDVKKIIKINIEEKNDKTLDK